MTVSTFYPDTNPESTSVDGNAGRHLVDETFAVIRVGAGTRSDDFAGTEDFATLRAHATTNPNYQNIDRTFLLFDTSSIPDGDSIDSADLKLMFRAKGDTFAEGGSVRIVTTTPASNIAIVNADYSQVGAVGQAADKTIASLNEIDNIYTTFALNATGLGNITKTGISKFGMREVGETDNIAPTWGADKIRNANYWSAEEGQAGERRPALVVTHTAPPVTFVPKMLVF